ncbi:cytochrome P450 3A29-like [Branchiostoma floridae x Branchiostoma japonicum]
MLGQTRTGQSQTGAGLYLVWPFSTFKKLGIPGPKPVPLFGHYLEYGKGINIFDQECYQKYNKIYGIFEGRQPILMIGDLDIVKAITVKGINTFTNHRDMPGQGEGKHALFFSKDETWKRLRIAMSPAFSSGKLKQLTVHIERCAEGFVSNLAEDAKHGKVFDVKELCGAFSMDVISSTAFGVEIDSLHNPDHPFVTNAKAIFDISLFNIAFFIMFAFPQLGKFLERFGMTVLPKKPMKFFSEAVDSVMDMRKTNPGDEKPVDFLQLMLKAHNEELDNKASGEVAKQAGVSKKEIKGNAVLFWVAGYDTTANTLTLTAYNLAVDQEAQDRAVQEVDTIIAKRGKLDYESVNELTFLEMCINETLRMFPASQRFDRVCKEDTEVNGLHIPEGTIVTFPVWAIHYDADIWPEPEKFKPERFSKEEKESRDPYAFLPFGAGPRNCLGMRIAMLELKFALAKALQKFRFVTCEKTEIPVRIKNTLGNQIEGEVWLKVEARSPAV